MSDSIRPKYWGTISWDGYDGRHDGEFTILRYKLDYLMEDLDYYLNQYSNRNPYVSCASVEDEKGESQDITDSAKKFLQSINKEENNGK
jgi:hypothetical protein|tara:strand:- start:12624 stop:12890 length:267 start_codon:yes stop_codon:yes gene_type:complete